MYCRSNQAVAAALVALSGLALAQGAPQSNQMNATAGPNPVPLGAPVLIVVSNDRPGSASATGCPWRIFDANQQLVFKPNCPPTTPLIGPYGWLEWEWDQHNQQGQQVPAGDYFVEVKFDPGFGPTQYLPVHVGDTAAGLVLSGPATIHPTISGQFRHFQLSAPGAPGALYLVLGAFTDTPGIDTCGGTLPLAFDALFLLALQPGALFSTSLGVLDAQGSSSQPTFPLPLDTSLLGLALTSAFVVLDPPLPCPISAVSGTWPMLVI